MHLVDCILKALIDYLKNMGVAFVVNPSGTTNTAFALDIYHVFNIEDIDKMMNSIAHMCNCRLFMDNILPIYDLVSGGEVVSVSVTILRDSNMTLLLVY